MLALLRIKNLALVEDLTLELHPGFNVITGETGAGKSILIGALNLVLGQRADRSFIRAGSEDCTVEALFHVRAVCSSLTAFLGAHGLEPCEGDQLVIKRYFSRSGTNRQFVNGSPTTLQTLTELGMGLVDIHGPHDHQSLLSGATQLEILDAYGRLQKARRQFATLVDRARDIQRQKRELIADEETYLRELEMLRFQVNEIGRARIQPDEEEELDQEYQRASNAVQRQELSQASIDALYQGESSILNQAGAVGRWLQRLEQLDPRVRSLWDLHGQAVECLNDLQRGLSRYADQVEVDPERLRALQDRLDLIHSLKRKYGPTLDAVVRFGAVSKEKLGQLERREATLETLNGEASKLALEIEKCGGLLSDQRRTLIPKIEKEVTRHLADLGFQKSQFRIRIQTHGLGAAATSTLSSRGFDQVEFLFGPNPGEPLKPLKIIASSGEIARVMLALKTVLAAQDQIPVLVFDEVDANVGGETSHAVGEKLHDIGRARQVICVTHLAPVAAAAAIHFQVRKTTLANRTISTLRRLKAKQRVEELARMLGGKSAAAGKHAETLLARWT